MADAMLPGRRGPAPGQNPPDLMHEAVLPDAELSRRNARFAIGLSILCLLLFGGTFAVAELYLSVT